MNAINYALTQIRRSIPEEVLVAAMDIDIPPESRFITSTDDKIVTNIIRGIVMMDSNIIGGIELIINLDGINIQLDNYYNGVFEVPMERTNGRLMVSVLGVGSISMTGANGYLGGMPQLPTGAAGNNNCCFKTTYHSNQANRIYNSFKGSFSDYNTNCTLIGPNVILVGGMRFFSGNSLGARVIVENDNNLNNIKPRSYQAFAQACVLAAKMYIYNKLIVKLDQGYLEGGQELGRFQSLIESYDSAGEDYNLYIEEVLGKVLYMNDPMRKRRFISQMLNTNF